MTISQICRELQIDREANPLVMMIAIEIVDLASRCKRMGISTSSIEQGLALALKCLMVGEEEEVTP